MSSTGRLIDADYLMKIIVIGDSGVGKSALTLRLSDNIFYSDHAATIAVDFRLYKMKCKGKCVQLQIWDTAGQERYQSLTTAFYRGANGIILCFDLTNPESFTNLDKWLARIQSHALPSVSILLVGCKRDLVKDDEQKLLSELAEGWARNHNMRYIETSAKAILNVEERFNSSLNLFSSARRKMG